MEKEKVEINVLDELNKGACMGRDAIYFVMDKVEDEDLKGELKYQHGEYKKIIDKISELYPEYSSKEPHETNGMEKVMTWYGISIRTMVDDSTSKIAEMILKGLNMGIIEGKKLLNHKDTDAEVEKIINDFVNMQEKAVERLKEFL